MTSLIDVLTLLLVFLIQSFSAEGNLITPSEDLRLPVSNSQKRPQPALTIEITKTAVLSEGIVIAQIPSFQKSNDLLINSLNQFLAAKKKLEAVGPNKGSEVIIQCDREIEFNVVKRVMFTCTHAGFTNFSVIAIEGSENG
jgi:biopolymer transport protein ExbD